MTTMNTLEGLRDALADIAGVASCKIGLEKNISPADYPLIRLVPSRLTPGNPYSRRTIETLIYFGMDTSEAEAGGLEGVYDALFTLEESIREVLKAEGGRYMETITDEDRLDTYKLMTVRCEVTQLAPPPPPPPPAPPAPPAPTPEP